jgi:hypothetical protein
LPQTIANAHSRAQVTRRVVLPLKLAVEHHGIPPLSPEAKKASRALLAEYAQREAAKRQVEKARNELESYIVSTRSKLGDDDIIGVCPWLACARAVAQPDNLDSWRQDDFT